MDKELIADRFIVMFPSATSPPSGFNAKLISWNVRNRRPRYSIVTAPNGNPTVKHFGESIALSATDLKLSLIVSFKKIEIFYGDRPCLWDERTRKYAFCY